VHALEGLGLVVDAVHDGPPSGELQDLPDGSPGADVVRANNALLREALLGPASYAVVARRAS
jgi:hypothetical protein